MNLRRSTFRRWLAAFSIFFMAVAGSDSRDLYSAGELYISSIKAEDANVIVTASVPAGLAQVALEARAALNLPWGEAARMEIPVGGGNFVFTIAKPGTTAFFRLVGTTSTDSTASQRITSPELNYVVIAPLGPESPGATLDGSTSDPNDAVFHFKGTIDGSDRILLTREGASWEHANWGWPRDGVRVNGTKWNPHEKNYMTTSGGALFLADRYSLEDANLELINGRGLVSLERGTNSMIVYLDDIENGSGEYEFKVRFHQRGREAAHKISPSATLKISARVDGYETFRITKSEATWIHGARAFPGQVKLNGLLWPVQETNVLKNEADTAYLDKAVDFSTARIVSRKGRDVATLWADADALWVRFADNPNGADLYELEIEFGDAGNTTN